MDFQEYPKWVTPPGSEEAVLVDTADEEQEVMTVNKGRRGRKAALIEPTEQA